jgi:hypothetical protein
VIEHAFDGAQTSSALVRSRAMDPRTLARLQALGRIVIGSAFALSPRLAGRAWVGPAADTAGAQVGLAAFGVRDAALGFGAAWALGGGEPARAWVLAGVASDAVDLAATFRRRSDLPSLAAYGSMSLAVTSIALGLWLQGEVE